jgi:hypothetical protein
MIVRVVHDEPKTPPDYKGLAQSLILAAKDMQRERDSKRRY